MPELPEVETVRRGLEKLIVGRKILNIEIFNDKSFQASVNDMKNFVFGSKIVATRRRAKVLIIDLSTNYSLVIHLKMTGQIVFREDAKNGGENWGGGHPTESFLAELPDKSTRVEFNLSSFGETVFSSADLPKKMSYTGAPAEPSLRDEPVGHVRNIHFLSSNLVDADEKSFAKTTAKLFFNDQRKFGWIKLVPTSEINDMDFIKKLGPEPLTGEPEKEFLQRVKRHANTTIKAAILSQEVIAGIGNIYADEALWGAKIHPADKVKDLTDAQLKNILTESIEAMRKSLAAGGSTMTNYVQADGSRGNYLDKFANVFRREGQPCPRCGTTIEKIRVAGRGTHICPKCQKLMSD